MRCLFLFIVNDISHTFNISVNVPHNHPWKKKENVNPIDSKKQSLREGIFIRNVNSLSYCYATSRPKNIQDKFTSYPLAPHKLKLHPTKIGRLWIVFGFTLQWFMCNIWLHFTFSAFYDGHKFKSNPQEQDEEKTNYEKWLKFDNLILIYRPALLSYAICTQRDDQRWLHSFFLKIVSGFAFCSYH